MRTLVWFRGKDLRTADHAALCDAVAAGEVIAKLGSQLIVVAGDPVLRVPELARAWGVQRVVARLQ